MATSASQVVFNQTGIGGDSVGIVLTVDGVSYDCVSMPVVFLWDTGSTHVFSFAPFPGVGSGKRYFWENTTGLSALQSGAILVFQSGSVVAHYATQFFLTLSTDPPLVASPSGGGWYDADTYAAISTDTVRTIRPGQKRCVFREWMTADLTDVTNSTSANTDVLMDSWKTVTANYTTQYNFTWNQIGLGSDFVGAVWSLDGKDYGVEDLPVSFWYDTGSVVEFAITPSFIVTPAVKQYVFYENAGSMTGGWKPHLTYITAGQYQVSYTGYFTCVYVTQYYLSVASAYGNPTPASGWYNADHSITSWVVSPWREANGTHYECTGWNGTGSVPSSGTETTVTFRLTSKSNIMWNWHQNNIQIRGDINNDGRVDIIDIVNLALAYGSKEGDSNWNAKTDLAQPFGQIDILDLITCAAYFGSTDA